MSNNKPVTVYLDDELETRVNRHRIPSTPGEKIPSFSEVFRTAAKRGFDEIERKRSSSAGQNASPT